MQNLWPTWPADGKNVERNLSSVVGSGRWSISGQTQSPAYFYRRICAEWSEYLGVKHTIPVASGTSGLLAALSALQIKEGDEVIVPAMTWVACANTVSRLGARAVYADLDDRTACISPAAIENLISERTRAIMVVHAYCSIANISEIMRIANARGIPVIEDCSQAHGATWGGQKVGSFGDIAVFSTQQSKLLTSGEGGLVSTNSDELYERLQYSINDGRRVLPDINSRNWMSLGDGGKLPGQNLNASEFTCAILSAQLEILDTQNRIRAESAQFLAEELSKAGVADVLATDERTSFRVYWRLLLKCNEEFVPSHQLEAYSERVSRLAALPVEKVDEPACRNRLLHRASVAFQTVHPAPEGSAMPTALWLHDRILAVPQFALLARRSRLVQLVEAFKVAGKV